MIAWRHHVVRPRVPAGSYGICICSIAGNKLNSAVTGRRQEVIPNFELDPSFTPLPENLGLLRNKPVTHVSKFGRFLGAIAKLQKATVSFLKSVCPSVRMEQLCSPWTDCHEIWYLRILWKSVEEIQVLLNEERVLYTKTYLRLW